MKKSAEDFFKNTVNQWQDTYNSCEKMWTKKWKKCESSAVNMADAFKNCEVGMKRNCIKFDKEHCESNKWTERGRNFF